jgi:hypothetical protein
VEVLYREVARVQEAVDIPEYVFGQRETDRVEE